MDFKKGDTVGTFQNFNSNSIIKGFYLSTVEWMVIGITRTPYKHSIEIIDNNSKPHKIFLTNDIKIYNVRMVLFEKKLNDRF
jgi:hypothetical protein